MKTSHMQHTKLEHYFPNDQFRATKQMGSAVARFRANLNFHIFGLLGWFTRFVLVGLVWMFWFGMFGLVCFGVVVWFGLVGLVW